MARAYLHVTIKVILTRSRRRSRSRNWKTLTILTCLSSHFLDILKGPLVVSSRKVSQSLAPQFSKLHREHDAIATLAKCDQKDVDCIRVAFSQKRSRFV